MRLYSVVNVVIHGVLVCLLFVETLSLSNSQQTNCETRCKERRAVSGALTALKTSVGTAHNLCMCHFKNRARERFSCLNPDGTTKPACRLQPNQPLTIQPGATRTCDTRCKEKRAASGVTTVFKDTNGIARNLCMCEFKNGGRERFYCLNSDGTTKLSCRPELSGASIIHPATVSDTRSQPGVMSPPDQVGNGGVSNRGRGSRLWVGCDSFCVKKKAARGIASRQKNDTGVIYIDCVCYFSSGRYEKLSCVNPDGSTKAVCTTIQPLVAPMTQPAPTRQTSYAVPKTVSDVCDVFCKILHPGASGKMLKTNQCWCTTIRNDLLFGFRTT